MSVPTTTLHGVATQKPRFETSPPWKHHIFHVWKSNVYHCAGFEVYTAMNIQVVFYHITAGRHNPEDLDFDVHYRVHKSSLLDPSWASWIQSSASDPISPKVIVILFPHPYLGHSNGLFLSGFLTPILYASPTSHMRATCLVQPILLDFITLITFCGSTLVWWLWENKVTWTFSHFFPVPLFHCSLFISCSRLKISRVRRPHGLDTQSFEMCTDLKFNLSKCTHFCIQTFTTKFMVKYKKKKFFVLETALT